MSQIFGTFFFIIHTVYFWFRGFNKCCFFRIVANKGLILKENKNVKNNYRNKIKNTLLKTKEEIKKILDFNMM